MKAIRQLGLWLVGMLVVPLMAAQAGSKGEPTSQDPDVRQWSFAANATGYIVPNDRSYVSPTFTAERKSLHLEARYNYEDIETGSLWVGYVFGFGKTVTFEVTPMVGGVFGNTSGIAPGYNLAVSYKKLELSSQSEFVVNTNDKSSSFFYTWSELSYAPRDWIRAGIVAERTKPFHTRLDIQRGLLVGISHDRVNLTAYIFNFGWTEPAVVLSLGFKF